MAIFSAIAAAVSGAVAWLGSTLIGSIALRLVAGLAFNALARALSGGTEDPQRRSAIVGQISQGADVPRSFILGRYGTAGSLVYHNTWGSGSSKNALYTRVTALSDIPVQGLHEVIVDGRSCTLDFVNVDPLKGFPIIEFSETNTIEGFDLLGVNIAEQMGLPIAGEITRDPQGRIQQVVTTVVNAWIKFYDGTQTEADAMLVNQVASEARPWPATSVGHGVAYAVMTFRMREGLWQGLPRVVFVVDGVPVTHPGTGATASTQNPAVLSHAVLAGFDYGGTWLYGGQAASAARLDAAEWAAEADKCDLPVPGADAMTPQEKIDAFGSETVPARYRAGIEVSVDRPVVEVLEDLMSAANARLADTGDRYRFQIGDPQAPAFTLTDADILSTAPQTFAPFLPLAETVNSITATYPSPEEQWENQEAPPLIVTDIEAEDGGRRLTTNVTLRAVPYKEQVQRLMKSALEEARRARRHGFTLPARYWGAEPGDYFEWTSERNGYVGKRFRIDGLVDLANGDVQIDATEVDPADYDWTAATDFTPVVPGSITRPPFDPGQLSDWAVLGTVVRDANGKDRRPAIQLIWTNAEEARRIVWQVRLLNGDSIVTSGSTDDIEAGYVVITEGLLGGETYQVRARPRFADGLGSWSGWLTVTLPQVGLTLDDITDEVFDDIEARAGATAQALIDSFDTGSLQPHIQAVFGANGLEDRTIAEAEVLRRDIDLRYGVTLDVDQALGTVTENLAWLTARLSDLDGRIADAGIYTDPDSGRVELYALQELRDRASALSLQLDAASAEISLRATYAEVDGLISAAMLDPTQIPIVDGLTARVSNAEFQIAAQAGQIALKADTTEVDGLDVRVTQAEVTIDSLTADLTLSVGRTEFDAVEARVTTAEITLGALDGASITSTVRDTRATADALDADDIRTLQDLLDAYEQREAIKADIAFAESDLRAMVNERTSVASLSAQIAAAFDDQLAVFDQQITAISDATSATVQSLTTLEATVGTVSGQIAAANGRIDDILNLQVDAGSVLAQTITTLEGQVANTASGLVAADGRIDDILSLDIAAGSVLAQTITALEGAVIGTGGDITGVQGQIDDILSLDISASSALARSFTRLEAQVGGDAINSVPDAGLTSGETWELGNGWALTVPQPDPAFGSRGRLQYALQALVGFGQGAVSAPFDVVPGARYRVGFRAQRLSGGSYRVRGRLRWLDTAGAQIGSVTQIADATETTAGIKSYSGEIVVPSAAARAQVVFQVDEDSTTATVAVGAPFVERISDTLQEARGSIESILGLSIDPASVLASTLTSLEGSVTAAQADVDNAQGRIDDIRNLTIGPGTALAQAITTLQTEVGDNAASLTQQAQSIDGIRSVWGVKADVNGHITGFGLISEIVDDEPVGAFSIVADSFEIVSPDGSERVAPLVVYTTPTVVDGELVPPGVYIQDAVIRDAVITRAKIKNGAVGNDEISRDQIIRSGEFGPVTIAGDLSAGASGFSTPEPVLVETLWIETAESAPAWLQEPHSYTATIGRKPADAGQPAGQYGSAQTVGGQADYSIAQWTMIATPTAVTRWTGAQRIWLKVDIYTRNIIELTNFTLEYKLRRVT